MCDGGGKVKHGKARLDLPRSAPFEETSPSFAKNFEVKITKPPPREV